MPLFQTSVLKNYLSQQDNVAIEQAYLKYSTYFLNLEIQQNISDSKEEQFQATFLTELFVNVLGYTINPSPKYNLTTEFKNEKGAKKADGAILKDGKALGVIELKGTDTKDLDKVNGQAFSYKNNHSACVYVITSNFEKLRFFVQNAVEHIEFNLFTLTREEFKVLWLCLHTKNLLSGIPLKIKQESLIVEENITKQLYKDYSAFKTALWHNMVKNHPDHDQLILFKKTQKLLDRFLFIFFAEDSGLLPPNSVSKIIDKWKDDTDWGDDRKLYDIFKQYFGFINSGRPAKGERAEIFGYNGGLFIEDSILDKVKIDDDILLKYSEKLSTYDFQSEVDVNILGHIFENSLNEIENITAELEGQQIDKSKTKRKKDGVFYTPKYITKYIVDNTIGKLCEEKKAELSITDERFGQASKRSRKGIADLQAYRHWLLDLKICDPACGSGAFLNQALEFLIDEHRYLDELTAQYHKSPLVLSDIETHILEQNIYGVDINEESVEIAKLSLWLRTAQRGRKLTSLNNNIKCGNSLIDDSEVAGNKAFNWQKEFPKVFAKGGFDVVIGNPPYVQSHSLDESTKEFIYANYDTAEYQINTYAIFIEKLINIISDNGRYSVIIPNYWLSTQYDSRLRKLIFLENECDEVLNVFRVFEDATVDTVILTGVRTHKPSFPKTTYANSIDSNLKTIFQRLSAIDGKLWKSSKKLEFKNANADTLISFEEKIDLKGEKCLGDFFFFKKGMQPYEKGKGNPVQTREMMNGRIYHSDTRIDDTYKPLLKARNVQRHYLNHTSGFIKYGKNLAAPRKLEIFQGNRILINRILSKRSIDGIYLENEFINNTDIFNLVPKSKDVNVKALFAFVVSPLCSAFFRKENINLNRATFPKINVNTLERFPIPDLSDDVKTELENLVDTIGEKTKLFNQHIEKVANLILSKFELEKLTKKLQNWHEMELKDFLKELKKAKVQLSLSEEAEWMQYFDEQNQNVRELKSEINRIDSEIDQMLYQLYGLTDEEIAIIENC